MTSTVNHVCKTPIHLYALQIPEIAGNVRTIVPQRGFGADGQIFVGTSRSCILAGSLPVKFRFVIQVCIRSYEFVIGMEIILSCL